MKFFSSLSRDFYACDNIGKTFYLTDYHKYKESVYEDKKHEPHSKFYSCSSNKENGQIGLMCPKCFNMVIASYRSESKTRVSTDVRVKEWENRETDIIPNIAVFTETPEFIFNECHNPSCDNQNFKAIKIDANIATAISIFNKKGFKTVFSCSSHSKDDHPYILFDGSEILDYIHMLPSTWYHDLHNDRIFNLLLKRRKWEGFGSYNRVTLRSESANYPECLLDILDFASALPYLNRYFK